MFCFLCFRICQLLQAVNSVLFPVSYVQDFPMSGNVSLLWQHLNIHKVNVTERTRTQSLQLQVKLLSPLPPGFALKVLWRWVCLNDTNE